MFPSSLGTLLHEDHMATVQTLQTLEEFLDGNRRTPALDDKAKGFLRHLAATMRAEVEKHFGFEENHLFPVFVNQGETGIVNVLTQDHRAILPLATEIADQADKGAAEGFSDDTWAAFRRTGTELIEREIFHIQKEEMGLLAAIAHLLPSEIDAELSETYKKVVR